MCGIVTHVNACIHFAGCIYIMSHCALTDRHVEEYMSEKVSYIVTLEDWDANFDQVISEYQYVRVYIYLFRIHARGILEQSM